MASALDACVAFPDRPDLLLVGRHSVVGEEGGGDRAGCPAELQALLGFPAFDQAIQDAADGGIAATYTVEDADVTRLQASVKYDFVK